MNTEARILVASDDVGDAAMVKQMLTREYELVFVSTAADRLVPDFEQHRPDVLVLAFKTLEGAERCYLGLYRLSKLVHTIPHRTVILCNRDDLQRVYALCKRAHFDDYVLFWPLNHDAPRLLMAVFHALQQSRSAESDGPEVAEFVAKARQLKQLESLLQAGMAKGREAATAASNSLMNAGHGIGAALETFSHRLAAAESPAGPAEKNTAALADAFRHLREEQIGHHLRSVGSAIEPVGTWMSELDKDLAPQLESVRVLQSLAAQVHPNVLLVDDDPFQHALVASQLAGTDLVLYCVASGTEALSSLRQRRPDLVLMDFQLPDMDGVEATRQLKAVPNCAAIPIIMITGKSDKDVVLESLKAGAFDFLVKPLDKARLQAKVMKGLGR